MALQTPVLKNLAIPAICLLVALLAYSSQYLFYHLDPAPLTTEESLCFNILVAATAWSYERVCRADPGRLPRAICQAGLEDNPPSDGAVQTRPSGTRLNGAVKRGSWCKKCEAVKPPRAHHCRQCARCIPKMDHHCPWTSNCVSHTTFPHFLRFVGYACVCLSMLTYFLSIRLYAVWEARNLPSYLGPSIWALAHLFALSLVTVLLLFALSILLVSAMRSLLTNTTMIESWEIERHEALVERARYLGGYVHGPGGIRVRITQQEFPYDIGIWKNLVQGMGGPNIIRWVLPFGDGPSNESGWGPWEENGFEDEGTQWPPIDPDKMPRAPIQDDSSRGRNALIQNNHDEVQAFRQRQQQDYKRLAATRRNQASNSAMADRKSKETHQHSDDGDDPQSETDSENDYEDEGLDGEAGWTNSEGDRLRDYSVDEEAEMEVDAMLLDDDVPLGELVRRRRGLNRHMGRGVVGDG